MPEATRPTTITCARCGTEKTVGQRGPIPVYCSGICRAALKHERSKQDGRYERALVEARQRTARRQADNSRPCPYCGTAMANPQRVQCGAPDCKRAFQRERVRGWQLAYKAKHGQWCRPVNYAEQQREYNRQRRRELGHWRQLYPAAAAAADARRRALVAQAQTGEAFAPADVHVRDGWICQLCHELIDQAIAWPDPKSPSLDHIIPLSKGGEHSMSNVQSAHLGCNSSKGDRDLVGRVVRASLGEPHQRCP